MILTEASASRSTEDGGAIVSPTKDSKQQTSHEAADLCADNQSLLGQSEASLARHRGTDEDGWQDTGETRGDEAPPPFPQTRRRWAPIHELSEYSVRSSNA